MKIKVTDMMCQHCVKNIDKALVNLEHTINLENKEVEVNDQDVDQAKELIKAAGYTVK